MKLGLGLGLFSAAPLSSAPFEPQARGDCEVWFDTRAGVTEASGVAAWADQGPIGDPLRNLAEATNKPDLVTADADFNGEDSISFVGANSDRLTSATFAASVSQPLTIYLVFRWSAGAGGYVFDGPNTRVAFTYGTGGNGFLYAGASFDVNTSADTTYVVCLVVNGASSAAYLDDPASAVATGDAGSDVFDSLKLGARFTNANFLTGKIAAFGAFSGAHNQTDRTEIMNGLSARYQ